MAGVLFIALPPHRALVARTCLVALAAAGLWLAARVAAVLRPPAFDDSWVDLTAPPPGVDELRKMEREVGFALMSAFDLNYRLRPRLRRLAEQRLLARRGIDLEGDAEGARRALGPAVWELVKPDEREPAREGPGVSLAVVEAAVRTLEEL